MGTILFIGIGHTKQQGKDTFAGFLCEHLNRLANRVGYATSCVTTTHFAAPIKQLCRSCFGLNYEQTDGTEAEKNSLTDLCERDLRPDCPTNEVLTAREVMQQTGSIIRGAMDNIWTMAPFRRSYPSDTKFVIIPDLRFPDEVEAIKSRGGLVIRMVRPGHFTKADNHISETALNDFHAWDAVVYNASTLQRLDDVARQMSNLIFNEMAVDPDPDGGKSSAVWVADNPRYPDRLAIPRDLPGARAIDGEYEDTLTDAEADADTLRSAGMGTDEDYGYFGSDDES
jgi:hypothetical protein